MLKDSLFVLGLIGIVLVILLQYETIQYLEKVNQESLNDQTVYNKRVPLITEQELIELLRECESQGI